MKKEYLNKIENEIKNLMEVYLKKQVGKTKFRR